MRAIIIDPHKRTITATDLVVTGGIRGGLAALRDAIGVGRRSVTRTGLARGVDLWTDDEGFLDEQVPQATQAYFGLVDSEGEIMPFAGIGVVLGLDEAGDTVDVPGSVDVAALNGITIFWPDAWAFERGIGTGFVPRPQSTMTSYHGDGRETVQVLWQWECPKREDVA